MTNYNYNEKLKKKNNFNEYTRIYNTFILLQLKRNFKTLSNSLNFIIFVKKKRDIRTNIFVALKIMNKRLLFESKMNPNQILLEIKLHSFLNHPNIINLYGFFEDDEKIYLIEEYAHHGELYKQLKQTVTISFNYFLKA